MICNHNPPNYLIHTFYSSNKYYHHLSYGIQLFLFKIYQQYAYRSVNKIQKQGFLTVADDYQDDIQVIYIGSVKEGFRICVKRMGGVKDE